MGFAIAVDGPAGVGKSTISKLLAEKLNLIYVDTGAMYRAVGFYCIENDIDLENSDEIAKSLEHIDIQLKLSEGSQKIFLNGDDVTTKIRTMEAGDGASKVAVVPEVRKYLVDMQRQIGENNSVIMDGRDIGTNVLKNADLKIYLEADSKVRAERRLHELREQNLDGELDDIEKEIILRDSRDKNREEAPLSMASDAILIDTSYKSIENVVDEIYSLAVTKRGKKI